MTTQGYENPALLWSPAQLHERLGDDANLAIIDVRAAATFAQGWIPGAVHFDLYGLSLNDTSPRPLAAFMWMIQHLFEQRGVNHDKTVVFYEGVSGMRAARGFWLLEYLGHQDVHVLDGGFKAWQAAGYAVTTEAARVREVKFQPQIEAQRHISADDLHGLLSRDDVAILDTRTDDEYTGKNIRAARGGTIPGAIHIEWTHNLNADGAFKSAEELEAMYAAAGIGPDKTVVPF
ncbi:MAG: rhodanese-like domain-containing protein [Candidatus Tectomicrobia bacterium]